MSKRGTYIGGHTLVPRSWLRKANPKLEKRHAAWAEEGEKAWAKEENRRRAKLETMLAVANKQRKQSKTGERVSQQSTEAARLEAVRLRRTRGRTRDIARMAKVTVVRLRRRRVTAAIKSKAVLST